MAEKKASRSPRATYGAHAPLGGASTTGPLRGAMIVNETVAGDPTKPVREAIALLESTRNSFKSKQVGAAREILEVWLESVLPEVPIVPDEVPPITLRLDGALALELAHRGEISGAAIKRDLDRFYAVMRDELARAPLTEELALLLCHYVQSKGAITSPRLFVAELEDAWSDPKIATPRPNPSTELINHLKALGPAALAATIDAAQQFWLVYPRYESDEGRALGRVGLLAQPRFGYGRTMPALSPTTTKRRITLDKE